MTKYMVAVTEKNMVAPQEIYVNRDRKLTFLTSLNRYHSLFNSYHKKEAED